MAFLALWLYGHMAFSLYKANELGNILAILETWTGVEHWAVFELTNEAIKLMQ